MSSHRDEVAPLVKKNAVSLLAIDDEPEFLEIISATLAREDLNVMTCSDAVKGLELAIRKHPQIILLDLRMPGMNGMELLEKILAADPGTDVIMITADYSTELAVEAIQKGASDYMKKPIDLEDLRRRVRRLVAVAQQRQQGLRLESELLNTVQFEGMVSQSPLMQEVFVQIRRIAPHFRTVLVSGATGTGKELVARALHALSPVASGPFAVCNSSALVETLSESELFGHVKGSFTGATHDKIGLFEYAQGGTIFLDEIGEMPLSLQTKLLRVLQNKEIQRVGSPAVHKIDVRVIAATHRDLQEMVEQKLFREDLYYRLCVVEIKLPRLSERKEDLPLLERHFLEHFAREYNKPIADITRRAQILMSRYSWPGNIRELENSLGRACMMAHANTIDLADLPERLQSQALQQPMDDDEMLSIDQMCYRHANRVLERVDGNKAEASVVLGISRSTLYRILGQSPNPEKIKPSPPTGRVVD